MSPGENASRSRPSRNTILILSKPGLVYMMPLAYFLLMSPMYHTMRICARDQ